MSASSLLWSPFQIASLQLANRLVRTAAGESLATRDGLATQALRDHYALLGREGAVGLMISGHVFVHPAGKKRDHQISLSHDNTIPGLSSVSTAAKRDGSRMFVQLSHAGLAAEEPVTGHAPLGPSPLPDIEGSPPLAELGLAPGVAMTASDIDEAIDAFAQAARRARAAGFDGVELHAGHGFLINQFLSPLFNRRHDAWGGSPEGRARFACEVIRAIRAATDSTFPVMAKVNAMDFLPGGLTLEESILQARLMQVAGLDAVEVSGGNCLFSSMETGPMRPVRPASADNGRYFAAHARAFHAALEMPVLMVGGLRSPAVAEKMLAQGEADLAGLCRPLIRDPGLALRWREGEAVASDCRSCNRCLRASREKTGLRCPLAL